MNDVDTQKGMQYASTHDKANVYEPDPERMARINREWDEVKTKQFPAEDLEDLQWAEPGTVNLGGLRLVDDQRIGNGRWSERRRMVFVAIDEPLKHWELRYEWGAETQHCDTFEEAKYSDGMLTCHLVKGVPTTTIVWERI